MKYLIPVAIVSFVIGCSYWQWRDSREDIFYCAKIEFKNAKEEIDTIFYERVTVNERVILRVYLPTGGWVEDLKGSRTVDSDSATVFDVDGSIYKIKLIMEGDCQSKEAMDSIENLPPEEDTNQY